MYYYVFICLDGIPILELLLNSKLKAVETLEEIKWSATKYIILDFKTSYEQNTKVIKKGLVKYQHKIITKQIIYFRININKAHKLLKQNELKFTRKEIDLMKFADKLFYDEPSQFLDYLKEKHIVNLNELKKFEKALEKITAENKILETWKNVRK